MTGAAPGAPEVTVAPTAAAAGELVAARVWARYAAARADGPFLLAVPAGRTPTTTFAAMVRLAGRARLDLSSLVVVLLDEYVDADGRLCDPAAHHSCRRFVRRHLLEPLAAATGGSGLRPDQVWWPDPLAPAAYDDAIAAGGGLAVALLASGASDGHVAFNPPGTPLGSTTRCVTLADTTRADNVRTFPAFGDATAVPARGVSVGLGTLVGAREVVLLLLGADKRRSFRRIVGATTFDPQWPATVVHACARPWIVADAAAANSEVAGVDG